MRQRNRRFKNRSIRKKLFLGIMTICVLVTAVITGTAMASTYNTMREQLIYNRRMSIGWLRDRMELTLSGYQEQFYEFEVNQEYKNSIQKWCIQGKELDYESRWQLITAMNEAISMDSGLNSMEIYNLQNGEALIAQRSGASLEETGDRLEQWFARSKDMQSNLVFLRTEKEILIFHQMHRFSDKTPYALIVMHLRPYGFQDILENIKMTADETVLVLNDEDQWIEADYGELSRGDMEEVRAVSQKMRETGKTEFILDGNFWFYREVGSSKLRVLLSVPDHVIMDSLRGTLMIALLVGGVTLFLSMGGSILFTRIFSNPIIRLSARMRHFTLSDRQQGEETQDKSQEDWKISQKKNRKADQQESLNEIDMLQNSFDIMVERNQKLIAQEYQKELEMREAQVHALQAQINPHFMYNVMQVIGGMALEREAPEIYRVTTALGDLMRYCLNFSRETVALREELHYLQSYCMLQNERFDGRIRLEILVEDSLQELLIPKLMLQPILENSFRHGLVNRPGEWILTVQGELAEGQNGEKDVLILTVTDNGCGMTQERLKEIQENLKRDAQYVLKSDAHIGLGNVDARIRLMYPEGDYGVAIDSREGKGTAIRIRMKAQFKEKTDTPAGEEGAKQ